METSSRSIVKSPVSVPRVYNLSVPQTMEEDNEWIGTSDSNSVIEGADGNFAVGNVRIMRPSPQNLGQSFVTNPDDGLMTKRGSETSLNNQFATGASYAMHGIVSSVDNTNNLNFDTNQRSSFTGGVRPSHENRRADSF